MSVGQPFLVDFADRAPPILGCRLYIHNIKSSHMARVPYLLVCGLSLALCSFEVAGHRSERRHRVLRVREGEQALLDDLDLEDLSSAVRPLVAALSDVELLPPNARTLTINLCCFGSCALSLGRLNASWNLH